MSNRLAICRQLLSLAAIFTFVSAAASVRAETFLKIEGVEGEVSFPGHEKEIDLLSYSFGLQNPSTRMSGGTAGGKAQFHEFNFTKYLDKSSPVLMKGCALGSHYTTATLSARKPGSNVEYLVVKMSDVIITSYNVSSSQGSVIPAESLSLNYAKIEFIYTRETAAGGPQEVVRAGWDLALSKPF